MARAFEPTEETGLIARLRGLIGSRVEEDPPPDDQGDVIPDDEESPAIHQDDDISSEEEAPPDDQGDVIPDDEESPAIHQDDDISSEEGEDDAGGGTAVVEALAGRRLEFDRGVEPEIDIPPKPEDQLDPSVISARLGGLGPSVGTDPARFDDGLDEPLEFDKGYLPPDADAVAGRARFEPDDRGTTDPPDPIDPTHVPRGHDWTVEEDTDDPVLSVEDDTAGGIDPSPDIGSPGVFTNVEDDSIDETYEVEDDDAGTSTDTPPDAIPE